MHMVFRKHQRNEGASVPVVDDDENEEGIKAMRYGSLGRIILNSVVASSIRNPPKLPQRTPAQQEEFRKEVTVKFFKSLNFSNMKELARLVREQFHEACLLIMPDISEPICGRKDITILFSLILERYPDSSWSPHNIATTQLDTMTCTYSFQGTSVFYYPMDNLFRQIRNHINKLPASNIDATGYISSRSSTAASSRNNSYSSNQVHPADTLNEFNSMQIVQEVSEYVHSTPNFTPVPIVPALLSKKLMPKTSMNSITAMNAITSTPSYDHMNDSIANAAAAGGGNGGYDNTCINISRRDPISLRDVKLLETTVLKDNQRKYRRKADFVFNEYDQVIRLIIADIH